MGIDADKVEIERLRTKFASREDLNFLNYAVSNKPGEQLTFHLQDDKATSFTSNCGSADGILVESMSIDKLVALHNLDQVDILSIDIEGNSGSALKGAKRSLHKGVFEVLHVELLSEKVDEFTDIFKVLINYDYRLFCVHETARFASKGVARLKPVPFIFDLTFVKNGSSERQREILMALNYDLGQSKTRVNIFSKIFSVIFDVVGHFSKKLYPRAFYRTVETDSKTFYSK